MGQILWADHRYTHWGSLHWRRISSNDTLLLKKTRTAESTLCSITKVSVSNSVLCIDQHTHFLSSEMLRRHADFYSFLPCLEFSPLSKISRSSLRKSVDIAHVFCGTVLLNILWQQIQFTLAPILRPDQH